MSGCHPQPHDIEDLLEIGGGGYWKENPEKFPEDVIDSGCKYFERGGRSSGEGGNSLVMMR